MAATTEDAPTRPSLLRAGGNRASRELAVPLNGEAEEAGAGAQKDAPSPPKMLEADFESHQQLQKLLEDHRYEHVAVRIPDIIDMIAEMRGVTRERLLETAVIAWFYHALGYRVLEAECREQGRTDDSSTGFLLFRVKLDADHDREVASLAPGEDLTKKFRNALVNALPGDLAGSTTTSKSSLEQMVQISWAKSGSIELGGVAALGLVMMIVMAIGVSMLSGWPCGRGMFPCVNRLGTSEGIEYKAALRELRDRGAEFEVNPDGSATLKVPPYRDSKWRCPDCSIL